MIRVEYIYGIRWGTDPMYVNVATSLYGVPSVGDLVKIPISIITYHVYRRRFFIPKRGRPKWQVLVFEAIKP